MEKKLDSNLAQEDAICTIDGPLLLISCPGSGKTSTMLRRMKRMVDIGIKEESILMVTFTDAAATEMRKRYEALHGPSRATICTIHALCRQIVLASSPTQYRILVGGEQYYLLQAAMREAGIFLSDMKGILCDISAYKNGIVELSQFRPLSLNPHDFETLFKVYEKKKKDSAYMDFDDLVSRCRNILQHNTSILAASRNKYQYIICDEYQDTNYAQRDILYLLAGLDGNICVVGDDDQSIYGFRGATPKIMLEFDKDYPNCKKIFMDTNYRSQPVIISTARNLIENNEERFKKEMKANCTGDGKVMYNTHKTRDEELDFLGQEIRKLIHSGTAPSEIAVLSRTNQQLDDVAGILEQYKIPYYARDEIADPYDHFIFKDLLSYLRLINGYGSNLDLIQILNKPKRSLSESDFKQVKQITGDNLIAAARSSNSRLPYKRKVTPIDSVKKLWSTMMELSKKPLDEQVQGIAQNIGYGKYLIDLSRSLNWEESITMSRLHFFVKDSKHYSDCFSWEKAAKLHIKNHKKQQGNPGAHKVTLSTMHRSKGLEWDTVFIVDCCAGIIPSPKAKSKEAIEEERRLLYVAVTRARETLYILNYIKKLAEGGILSPIDESPFIQELKGSLQKKKAKEIALAKEHAENLQKTKSDFVEGNILYFEIGMEVHHNTFGPGTVISKSILFVNIRFNNGIKMFPLKAEH